MDEVETRLFRLSGCLLSYLRMECLLAVVSQFQDGCGWMGYLSSSVRTVPDTIPFRFLMISAALCGMQKSSRSRVGIALLKYSQSKNGRGQYFRSRVVQVQAAQFSQGL